MLYDKKNQSVSELRRWLNEHGHGNLYGDWLDYCIVNSDSTTTLEDWLQANHSATYEAWKAHNRGSHS